MRAVLIATAAATALGSAAWAQQGPPQGPAVPVESGELREAWNPRVSAGPPPGTMPEFDGWSLGTAMPLAR